MNFSQKKKLPIIFIQLMWSLGCACWHSLWWETMQPLALPCWPFRWHLTGQQHWRIWWSAKICAQIMLPLCIRRSIVFQVRRALFRPWWLRTLREKRYLNKYITNMSSFSNKIIFPFRFYVYYRIPSNNGIMFSLSAHFCTSFPPYFLCFSEAQRSRSGTKLRNPQKRNQRMWKINLQQQRSNSSDWLREKPLNENVKLILKLFETKSFNQKINKLSTRKSLLLLLPNR